MKLHNVCAIANAEIQPEGYEQPMKQRIEHQRNQKGGQTKTPSHYANCELASASDATKTALPDAAGARTVESPQIKPQQETLRIECEIRATPGCTAVPRCNTYSTEHTSNVLPSSKNIENMASSCPPRVCHTYSEMHSNTQAKHTAASRRRALDRNRLKPGRPPDGSYSHSARAPPAQGGAQHE